MTGTLARPGGVGASGTSDRDYYRSWFETVAAHAGGLAAGTLLRIDADQPSAVLGRWPDDADAAPDAETLRLAREAASEGEGHFEPGDAGAWRLAWPVRVGPRVRAVVVVLLPGGAATNPSRAMSAIQWGSAWLVLRLAGDGGGEGIAETALSTIARVLDSAGTRAAAVALVQELARLTDAERVSLAMTGGSARLRLLAVSDVSEFNPRMNEVRRLEAAMREAVDARVPVVYEATSPETGEAWSAHAALREGGAGERIETHPLFVDGEPVGALLIEHREGREIGATLAPQALSGLLAIAARGLHLQSEATAGPVARLARAVRARLRRWFGARGYRARTAAVALLAVTVYFSFAQGDYRLGAEAQVEAAFQRVLSAPWNGYLAQASVRPGDEVRAGDVLMRLDDREQTLERVRWSTEVEKLRRKLDQATAARDRAAIMVASAQLRQAEAQLALVDSQLARIEVVAPFDGLIVSGDPTQRLGDVLKKGEVVYQIAPLHAYRLMIRVPETRIADLRPGMEGTMRLGALPGLSLRLRVDRIHPFTQRRDGQSFFVAESTIEGDLARVRPGMEGVATIMIDRRNLFGIWTRGLVDRLRLVWWSLFG